MVVVAASSTVLMTVVTVLVLTVSVIKTLVFVILIQ